MYDTQHGASYRSNSVRVLGSLLVGTLPSSVKSMEQLASVLSTNCEPVTCAPESLRRWLVGGMWAMPTETLSSLMPFVFITCRANNSLTITFPADWTHTKILTCFHMHTSLSTGFVGFRLGTSGGLLWTRWWTFGPHNRGRVYWPAERLQASQNYSVLWV